MRNEYRILIFAALVGNANNQPHDYPSSDDDGFVGMIQKTLS
jgi:hypothetical protein